MCTLDDAVDNIMKSITVPSLREVLHQVLGELMCGRPSGGDSNSDSNAAPATEPKEDFSSQMQSPTIDLFNATLRNNNAVSVALVELERVLADPANAARAVAWGNTNLVPRHFRCVLDAALRHSRPVQFVRW